MEDKKPSQKPRHKTFWAFFIGAMGGFALFNLYLALQAFGVID
ncbi:MAG: hypothetical protein AAF907_16280 [Planctomycetota bacterium]